MGMNHSKKRCKICSTKNKEKNSHICEECVFIPSYITKYGRENLKRIINNSYTEFENPIVKELMFDRCNTIKEKSTNKIEMLSLQPSAPLECNNTESVTDNCIDNYNIKSLSRCKAQNCSCKDRHNHNQFRTSVYNPPSYPTN